MTKITAEELVRYLYNETSEQKTAAIKSALQTDWNLRETFENLQNSHRNLDKIKLSPSTKTVNNILEYASKRQSQVHSL
jgi:hypothetical protein